MWKISEILIDAVPFKSPVGKPTVLPLPIDLQLSPSTLVAPTAGPGKLTVVVKDPSGKEIHSKFSVKNGQPLVQFTPKVPGPYKAEIFDGPEKKKPLGEIPIEATFNTPE